MGVKTGMSVEQYLHTNFPDLDREYRDSELVERSSPEYLHGKTQLLLAAFFAALRKRLSIFPCTETRMRVRSGRYVTPDLAVFWRDEPMGVPETPPLIAVEILSRDDRLTEVRD
jgi:Uma2 family endonuclease